MEQFVNNAQTTLGASIDSTQTWITVASATGFPTSPQFRILISDPTNGDELMLVRQVSGTTWTVERHIENTTGVAHALGDTVTATLTAGAVETLRSHYFNVKDYGALGDGSTDDTSAINGAISAATSAQGGTVYFPNGTYIVSATSGTTCIAAATNVALLGQSREGAIIKLANGAATSAKPVTLNGVSDVTIRNLTLDGNKANLGADTSRSAIYVPSATRVYLADLTIHDHTGCAVNLSGNGTSGAQDVIVERCYAYSNGNCAAVIDGGGQQRLTFRDCIFTGNPGQVFVTAPVTDVMIESSLLDANTGGYAVEIAGTSSTGLVAGTRINNCTINGPVLVAWASYAVLANNQIATGAADVYPPVTIEYTSTDIILSANQISLSEQTSGSVATCVYGMSGIGTPGPVNLRLVSNTLSSAWPDSELVTLVNVTSAQILGNTLQSYAGTNTGAGISLRVTVTSPAMDTFMIANNTFSDPYIAVTVGGYSDARGTINDLVVASNIIELVDNTSLAGAFSLDSDGLHVLQQAAVFGNDLLGFSTGFVTYPNTPMLVGGARGGGGVYNCAGSPASVITEIVGAVAYRRDGGSGSTLYVKESGAGTSSGWVAK